MAQDLWFIGPDAKIAANGEAVIRISAGRGTSLVLDLGSSESDVRHTVEKLRKALAALIAANGGE